MKPTFNDSANVRCPLCKAEGVRLLTPGTTITWCEAGHLVVEVHDGSPPKLVHDFEIDEIPNPRIMLREVIN